MVKIGSPIMFFHPSEVLETRYLKNTTTNLEEEHKATKLSTPRSQMGSNNVNNTPREYGST
jgi:hypothetical protein